MTDVRIWVLKIQAEVCAPGEKFVSLQRDLALFSHAAAPDAQNKTIYSDSFSRDTSSPATHIPIYIYSIASHKTLNPSLQARYIWTYIRTGFIYIYIYWANCCSLLTISCTFRLWIIAFSLIYWTIKSLDCEGLTEIGLIFAMSPLTIFYIKFTGGEAFSLSVNI